MISSNTRLIQLVSQPNGLDTDFEGGGGSIDFEVALLILR